MIPDIHRKLIVMLKQKTTDKKAIWNKTSGKNEFKIEFDDGSITIDSWQHEVSGKWWVDLIIRNDKGDIIDKIAYNQDHHDDYNILFDLHTIVKRNYLKIDETINNIFKQIEGDKTIGKKGLGEGDDLPF